MATFDVETLDFEPEMDDLMEDEVEASPPSHLLHPQLKSTVAMKTKGRGFRQEPYVDRYSTGSKFDSFIISDSDPGPERSVEGWIVLVTGVHLEAQEEDLHNAFAEFGAVKNLHLNLDRRTGFTKGYALIEYESFEEAQAAISAANGAELLTQTIGVDWAFYNGPSPFSRKRRSPRGYRSRTPPRRRF